MSDLIPLKAPKRSMLLTLLCMLTFLNSGMDLVRNIGGLVNAEHNAATKTAEIEQRVTKEQRAAQNDAGKAIAQELDMASEENLKFQATSQIIACLLCLIGAALMFLLKIYGFWFYLAGAVISAAVPIYLYHWSTVPGLIALVISGVVGLVFVLLYAYCMYNLRQAKEQEDFPFEN